MTIARGTPFFHRIECEPTVHCVHTVIVIDREMNVVLEQAKPPLSDVWVCDGRLVPELEDVVREVAANWIHGPSTFETIVARISAERAVRMVPLEGLRVPLLALTIESQREGRAATLGSRAEDQLLLEALERFSLTQREVQVLRCILDGAQAEEIAKELHIAENTVQIYFKRLLAKTRARNRASMVATVLNWGVSRKRVGG